MEMFKDIFVDSPLFGKSMELTDAGEDTLKALISEAPLAVFQTMNKALNKLDLCFQIGKIGE